MKPTYEELERQCDELLTQRDDAVAQRDDLIEQLAELSAFNAKHCETIDALKLERDDALYQVDVMRNACTGACNFCNETAKRCDELERHNEEKCKEVTAKDLLAYWLDNPIVTEIPMKQVTHPSDDDIRMLLDTYRHCRKFAHAGEVGANAVTLIAALEELLELRQERVEYEHALAQWEMLYDSTRRKTESDSMGTQVSAGLDGSIQDQAGAKRTET